MKLKSSHIAALFAASLVSSAPLLGQAAAAGNVGAEASAAPTVPTLNRAPEADTVRVTLGAAESILWGYNGYQALTNTTSVNGTAAYVSGSELHPFSILYSGGYLFGSSGQPSGAYQNLGVSQQFLTKHFGLVVGDTFSYLPNAPVFGLSGVPGVGDIGTTPIASGTVPVDSILTDFGRRITNTADAGFTYKFSPATALNTFANYSIQRFLDSTGIDNNEVDAGVSLDHRFSALNAAGAGYVFSRFLYNTNPALGFNYTDFYVDSHQFNARYQHVFSRKLVLNAALGPEFISSSLESLVPNSTTLAANVALTYSAERTSYLASFTDGTAAGGGVLIGTKSANANFTVNHSFTRDFDGSVSTDYGHATSLVRLANSGTTADSFYAGVQATRRFGRFWSAYASYNFEHQNLTGPLVAYNAFSGNANVLGFGVNYSPRPWHVRR